jgi:hypothetical protein
MKMPVDALNDSTNRQQRWAKEKASDKTTAAVRIR